MDHEWVPLSLTNATGAGSQIPAQSVSGSALLHDPLQHLFDPPGHIHTGLRRAPVPQQLYVSSLNLNFTILALLSALCYSLLHFHVT